MCSTDIALNDVICQSEIFVQGKKKLFVKTLNSKT